MSEVYAPTRTGRIRMFQEARVRAERAQDWSMVRAMDAELAALGVLETTDESRDLEMAVPAKPRRGRRPQPRCEHNMILARCPDCRDEGV